MLQNHKFHPSIESIHKFVIVPIYLRQSILYCVINKVAHIIVVYQRTMCTIFSFYTTNVLLFFFPLPNAFEIVAQFEASLIITRKELFIATNFTIGKYCVSRSLSS